jgi:hypothetical protein
MTRDVDALVILEEASLGPFIASGEQFGFQPMIHDTLDFAVEQRVLLMQYAPAKIPVDLLLGTLSFEHEMVERAEYADFGGTALPVPRVEDLLVMKLFARRERDRADAESLLAACPDLDVEHVRGWLAAFSELMEDPSIAAGFERMLESRQTP